MIITSKQESMRILACSIAGYETYCGFVLLDCHSSTGGSDATVTLTSPVFLPMGHSQ